MSNINQEPDHKFWATQPVPPTNDSQLSDPNNFISERIEPIKDVSEVKQEPYKLPTGYEWFDCDLEDKDQMNDIYTLLAENYVEDDDNMFRFDYSSPFLKWALKPPGWKKEWHVGVRVIKTKKLVGFITAIPANISVHGDPDPMVEINFLCVHKKLRSYRLAPVLIKEITRRVNITAIFEAVYTAGIVLPRPVSSCRYHHRSLNPKKLIDIGFSQKHRKLSMAAVVRLYKMPPKTITPGFRELREEDIPQAFALLSNYLKKFKLYSVFSEEEFVHWFTPRNGIVHSYVVEKDGEITDFTSFYILSSTIIGNDKYQTLKAAYSFYNVATQTDLTDLMKDTLICCNNLEYDVFNCLDIMENSKYLTELKFGVGDGKLQYYLYNWRCTDIEKEDLGVFKKPMDAIKNFSKDALKKTETIVRALPVCDEALERKEQDKDITVLIISPNWKTYSYLSKEIKKILFTQECSKTEMQEHDLFALKSYVHIEYFENYEETCLVEYKATELHKKFNFTHILAHSEGDLIRAARIRDLLGLTNGQSIQSALSYRDKVLMKNILSSHSIRVPEFDSVEGTCDILKFIQKNGYPVVIKPRKGYSSVNTTILKNQDDLEDLLKKGLQQPGSGLDSALDLNIDKFIEGPMFHVDGMVINKEVKFVWPTKYLVTVVNFNSNDFVAGVSLDPKNILTKRIQKYIVDVVNCLGGPKDFPFHGEVWHTPDDQIILCEIASRTGGGGIKSEILELFKVDLTKIWSQTQCDDFITSEWLHDNSNWEKNDPKIEEMAGWIYVYPKLGKIIHLPTLSELENETKHQISVSSFVLLSKEGEIFTKIEHCADAVASIVVLGKTEEETTQNVFKIYEAFSKLIVYENLNT